MSYWIKLRKLEAKISIFYLALSLNKEAIENVSLESSKMFNAVYEKYTETYLNK